ncbi:hypothetical protein H4Q26_008667 [Puccinia striiformis f. sp. tritici PST-130]|nr:hypothetical protein H4Q26_008667 [Puccinia striiformis f. sp. tritici PST-130]
MAAVTSPTLANTASPEKAPARPMGWCDHREGWKDSCRNQRTDRHQAGVSKAVQGVHDRIFSVSGGLEGVSKRQRPRLAVPPPTATTTIIRVLVSHNLMGSIIGRQAQRSKKSRTHQGSGMVASKEMLPQSTERVVEVQGAPEAIRLAIHEIGKCLMDDWERAHGTVLYQPGAPSSQQCPLGAANGGALPTGTRRASNYNPAGMENPPHRSREGSLGASLPPLQPIKSCALKISLFLLTWSDVLSVKVARKSMKFRRLSGSKISIAKTPHDESGERMFTIIGSPEPTRKLVPLI